MSLEIISLKREDGDTVKLCSNKNNNKPLDFEVRIYGEDNGEYGSCSHANDNPLTILEAFMFEVGLEENMFNLLRVIAKLELAFDDESPQREIFTVALYKVQVILGQNDGGTAGIFFSGVEDDWRRLDYNWRVGTLTKYVQTELNLACQSWGEE